MRQIERSRTGVVRVAFQDPKPGPPGQPVTPPRHRLPSRRDTKATIEQAEAAENIARQQLTNDVEQRLQAARNLLNQGQPEAALSQLRLTQNVVRSATNVAEDDRNKLDRRIQAQLLATVQAEERIVAERAEHQRVEAAAEQRIRAIDFFQRNKETIAAMMIQFDTLITEGTYNVLC